MSTVNLKTSIQTQVNIALESVKENGGVEQIQEVTSEVIYTLVEVMTETLTKLELMGVMDAPIFDVNRFCSDIGEVMQDAIETRGQLIEDLVNSLQDLSDDQPKPAKKKPRESTAKKPQAQPEPEPEVDTDDSKEETSEEQISTVSIDALRTEALKLARKDRTLSKKIIEKYAGTLSDVPEQKRVTLMKELKETLASLEN